MPPRPLTRGNHTLRIAYPTLRIPPYRIPHPTPPLSVSHTHHAQCVWSPSPCKPYPYAWSSYRLIPKVCASMILPLYFVFVAAWFMLLLSVQCMCVCIDSTVRLLVVGTGLLVRCTGLLVRRTSLLVRCTGLLVPSHGN